MFAHHALLNWDVICFKYHSDNMQIGSGNFTYWWIFNGNFLYFQIAIATCNNKCLLFSGLWKHHLTIINLTISSKTLDAFAECCNPYADYQYAECCVVPEKVITQGRKQKILFATDQYHTWYFHSFWQSTLGAKIFRSFFTWSAPPLFILDLVIQSDAPPPHILDLLLW